MQEAARKANILWKIKLSCAIHRCFAKISSCRRHDHMECYSDSVYLPCSYVVILNVNLDHRKHSFACIRRWEVWKRRESGHGKS